MIVAGVVTLVFTLAAAGAATATSPPESNPWLIQAGTLNMAHQGGEFEAPSSTMYAFRTALEDRGADSLEMDVNITADDRLAVMHDYYTRRITPLDAQVRDLTLDQLQALDAAWWFRPGSGQFDHSRPAGEYPLRGVRTGETPPPEGYSAEDFRVPSIEEVLAAFPGVPLNIEIKSVPSDSTKAIRSATLLAGILNRPENRDRRIIVASLDQNVLVRFHQLAPEVDLSASIASMARFIADRSPIEPEPAALQVPMVLGNMAVPRVLQEMNVRRDGFAVHAWTDGAATENDASYADLIDSGVQGIMTSSPSVLDGYLCRAGNRRPDRSPRCPAQLMKYRLGYPVRSLRRVLLQGLAVRARCDQACSVKPEAGVRPRVARRLGIKVPKGLKPGKLVRIAVAARTAQEPRIGINTFRARVSAKAFRRLARVRHVRVRVSARVRDGAGWHQNTEHRWLKLKSAKPLRPRR